MVDDHLPCVLSLVSARESCVNAMAHLRPPLSFHEAAGEGIAGMHAVHAVINVDVGAN